MDDRSRQEPFLEPIIEWREFEPGFTHPFTQRGPSQRDTLPFSDLGNAIERQMILIFGHDDPAENAGGCHAALND